jgi:hypothetical protein
VLPLLTGFAANAAPGWVAQAASIGVVAGVPLVALGITATQLGFGPWLEGAAAVLTAGSALLVGLLHLGLVRRPGSRGVVRMLWGIAALALIGSMALAGLYGVRFVDAVPALDVPTMWALHGTANALGFALCGTLAWSLARGSGPRPP